MNSQTLLKSICNRSIAALVISLGLLSAASDSANAQMMERRGMGGMDGGRDRGGMRGGDIGVGVGIGVGTAIIQQGIQSRPTADEPVPVRSKKTTKKAKRTTPKSDVAVRFDGKPTDVAFNPEQQSGGLGKRSGHKVVLVEKDGHYFKRNYYSRSERGDVTWYWYETPLVDSDPIIPLLPYAAKCSAGEDECLITKRKPSDPDRLKPTDSVIGVWWWPPDWFSDDPPVQKGVCKVVVTRRLGDVNGVASCVNAGGSCTSACDLYDAKGDNQGQKRPKVAPVDPEISGYSCKCPSN